MCGSVTGMLQWQGPFRREGGRWTVVWCWGRRWNGAMDCLCRSGPDRLGSAADVWETRQPGVESGSLCWPFQWGGECGGQPEASGGGASRGGEVRRMEIQEFQLDFDCAQKKLTGYAEWVKALRHSTGSVPLVITALPSWLSEPAFPSLAREAKRYVLQVHSVVSPLGMIGPRSVILCWRSAGWCRLPGLAFRLKSRFPLIDLMSATVRRASWWGLLQIP